LTPTQAFVLGAIAGIGFAGFVLGRTSLELRRLRRSLPSLPLSPRPLPPNTRRQLDRAARANRLELVNRKRNPSRWISPASGDFDAEDTQ